MSIWKVCYIFFYQSAGTLWPAQGCSRSFQTDKTKTNSNSKNLQPSLAHRLTKQDQDTATMFQPESFLSLGKQLVLRATVVVLATDLTRFRSMFGTVRSRTQQTVGL
jgi:hypothetical protein